MNLLRLQDPDDLRDRLRTHSNAVETLEGAVRIESRVKRMMLQTHLQRLLVEHLRLPPLLHRRLRQSFRVQSLLQLGQLGFQFLRMTNFLEMRIRLGHLSFQTLVGPTTTGLAQIRVLRFLRHLLHLRIGRPLRESACSQIRNPGTSHTSLQLLVDEFPLLRNPLNRKLPRDVQMSPNRRSFPRVDVSLPGEDPTSTPSADSSASTSSFLTPPSVQEPLPIRQIPPRMVFSQISMTE